MHRTPPDRRRKIPTAVTAGQSSEPAVEKKTVANSSTAEVREQITDMIRQNLPELSKAYNEALKKEAEKQAAKKPPQKETISAEVEKKAT